VQQFHQIYTQQSFQEQNHLKHLAPANNQRGPIKATAPIAKDQPTQQIQEGESQGDISGLCIDNRKKKEQQFMTQQSLSSAHEDSDHGAKCRFNQTNFDDIASKYIKSDELEPLENPEQEFKRQVVILQKSSDWSQQFEACNQVRRISKHHPAAILQQGPYLQTWISLLIRLADSLRSSLSKIALLTINDMFQFLKRCMEPNLDSLMKILLKKGTDTNSFISDEADNAMVSMCNNCMDSKVLQVILAQNLNSRSNIMRQKISKCLQALAR